MKKLLIPLLLGIALVFTICLLLIVKPGRMASLPMPKVHIPLNKASVSPEQQKEQQQIEVPIRPLPDDEEIIENNVPVKSKRWHRKRISNTTKNKSSTKYPSSGKSSNVSDDNAHKINKDSKDTVLKNASLAVAYPYKMKWHDTKSIVVNVSVNSTQNEVTNIVRKWIKEEYTWTKSSDSTSTVALDLQLYQSLKIFLTYDTTDFHIEAFDPDSQQIKLNKPNMWVWDVKAMSHNKAEANIKLHIIPYSIDGGKNDIPERDIPITIYFDYFEVIIGWIRYLGDKPEYTIPSILVPIIGYLFATRRKKKDSDKLPNNKDDNANA